MKTDKRKEWLMILKQQIEEGFIQKAETEWGGADVAVVKEYPETRKDGFYPDPQFVVTSFSLELSWVLEQLRDIFSDALDYMNKYEFYGQLANAAVKYIEVHGDQNPKELLLAVVNEAESMIK